MADYHGDMEWGFLDSSVARALARPERQNNRATWIEVCFIVQVDYARMAEYQGDMALGLFIAQYKA